MSDADHQLAAIELGDQPDAWRTAGFAVDTSGRLQLGSTEIRLTGRGGTPAWSIVGVDAPIDGLPVVRDADRDPAAATAHPNGITRIDHVVISTGDGDRTVDAFTSAGLPPRRTREVTDGPHPMRQTFCWAGDVIIEIVAPLEPDGAAPLAATWFGLALVADDLDDTAARLGDLLSTPRDAVQAGRRIAGLRHLEIGISLPVAVMSPHR